MFRGIHHQHALGHLALAGLHQQRRDQDGVGRFGPGQVLDDLRADQRVQQLLQPAPFLRRLEDPLAQGGAVELAIGQEDAVAEAFDDLRQGRTPGSTTQRAAWSASTRWTPREMKCSAAALLPLPIPPVRPSIQGWVI